MTPTPNPTAEQILSDEWIRQADRAKSMTGMDAIWFPDAEETLAALRAHNLLPEGAPNEAMVEAAAKAIEKIPHIVWNSPTRQDAMTLARAALVAAQGAAPQAETPQCGPCRRGQHGCCDGNEYLRCDCGHVTPVPSSGVDEDKLAEVERAAAARALEEAASDWAADPDTWGDNEKDYRNELRARAAEIRGDHVHD